MINHPLAHLSYYKWLATSAVMIGMMGSVLSSTMVNIAIPNVMGAYGIGQDQAHWMSTAFLSAMPVMTLMNGWFVQNFGARATFIGACLVFITAAAIGQFMPNYWGLVAVRTVQGGCAGLLQPLTMSVIFPLFPPEERGRAMAIYFMGFILGPALGPTVGGIIVDYANWRDVFGYSIPLMVIAVLLGLRFLPYRDTSMPRATMNWTSLVLVALAIGSFLTGISNGQRIGWGSPTIFGLLFIAGAAFLSFIAVELVSRKPLLEMRLFSVRSFSISTMVGFVLGAGMFGSLYLLPVYAQNVLGYTAFKAGILIMITGFIQFPMFPFGGRLAQSRHTGVSISSGMVLFGISSLILAGTDINSSFWYVAGWAAFGRIGLSVAMPCLQNGAMRDLPGDLVAYGAGTLSFVRMTGAAMGTSILAVTMEGRMVHHADHIAATQTAGNSTTVEMLERVTRMMQELGVSELEETWLAVNYLGRVISTQATSLAFQDGWMLLSIGFFVAALSALALIIKAPAKQPADPDGPGPSGRANAAKNKPPLVTARA